MTIIANRCRDGLLDRPMTRLQTHFEGSNFQTIFTRPLWNGFCNSIKCALRAIPFVAGLLVMIRPFAVIRGVTLVVIDAVNALFSVGTISHIGKEIFKAINPSVTNSDASCAVVFVSWRRLIQASLLHGRPRGIFRSLPFPVRGKSCAGASLPDFIVKASAGFRHAVTKSAALNKVVFPTVASALPFLGFVNIFGGDKSPKSLTSKVVSKIRPMHNNKIPLLCVCE